MSAVLLGIPFDAASSWKRGAAAAPGAIRKALESESGNRWSESLVDTARPGFITDAGDLDVSDPSRARETIEAGVRRVVSQGARPLSLGGDHSVTYPIMRAIAAAHAKVTLLQIDAHPDLYTEFQGDRYSHACPFARIMEERLAAQLVQVGIRAMTGEQKANAERFGVTTIDMRAWQNGTRPKVSGPIYLSIDMDGFDPAFAPGVSHREPGGLSSREVLALIQQLDGPIVGADIVELNPGEDVGGLTAPLCAKLVKELAVRMNEEK
jgi:agmatinase